MDKVIERILITEFDIKKRIAEMVFDMADKYQRKDVVFVSILKGSFMFLADLVRNLYIHDIQPIIDFAIASSYGDSVTSSGAVNLERGITTPVKDKPVLLIDDILDTGRTMNYLKDYLTQFSPQQIETCVLLDKPSRRLVDIRPDYKGFEIEDFFVVGYGLDYNNKFRELPYIAVLNPKANPPT
ncbi:hypoxanthine phosphoribosyltransferase [Chlamydiota bacterium]